VNKQGVKVGHFLQILWSSPVKKRTTALFQFFTGGVTEIIAKFRDRGFICLQGKGNDHTLFLLLGNEENG
jgi:hypothetical protein